MQYKEENGLFIPSNYKRDFMTSEQNSKGGRTDPLNRQYQSDKDLTMTEIKNIYKTKRIAQNIIDIPAEDATREWISIMNGDDSKKSHVDSEDILNKLNNLDAQPTFEKFLEYERLTGDGFISLGVTQRGSFDIEEELEENSVRDIDYLHPFSQQYVQDALLDDDPFSPDYNKFVWYDIKPLNAVTESRLVHSSRVLHIQTRVLEGETRGTSLLVPLYDPLLILDNFAWSIGQIAFAMTFKVYKSPDINTDSREQVENLEEELEKRFNSMSLAMIGENESLTHEGPGGSLPNLEAMTQFIWDYIAGAARMPKSHILGQQQGTITGAQYDSLNYYMRISGMQENYLRPHLERLINLLYKASDSGIGSGSVDEPEYSLQFNPLWKLDKQTDMEIRKLQAEIDEKYLKQMVLSPEQVRKMRFGDDVVGDAMMFDNEGSKEFLETIGRTQKEIAELAEYVHEKEKEDQEG